MKRELLKINIDQSILDMIYSKRAIANTFLSHTGFGWQRGIDANYLKDLPEY